MKNISIVIRAEICWNSRWEKVMKKMLNEGDM